MRNAKLGNHLKERTTFLPLFFWFGFPLIGHRRGESTNELCSKTIHLNPPKKQILRWINHNWFLPLSGQLESATNEAHESSVHQVSGCYRVSSPSPVLIEHCCLRAPENKWIIKVKCRTMPSHREGKRNTNPWRNVTEVYPDATVEEIHNDIKVTLPTLCGDTEIAAFGIPGNDDQKRMQMAIFGKKPTQGRDWKIRVYLIDDSTIAFKVAHYN